MLKLLLSKFQFLKPNHKKPLFIKFIGIHDNF